MKEPVAWTTKPVIMGAVIPARLPIRFCMPIQRPPAAGPARVWPTVNIIGLIRPVQAPLTMRQATIHSRGLLATARMARPPPAMPAMMKPLRTKVVAAPLAIRWSDRAPLQAAARPCVTQTAAPAQAMAVKEKCSALTRNSGSQVKVR